MQNYIVILKIPKNIENKIKSSYKETYDKNIPIKNLHLTLLPPFSLKSKESLELLKNNIKKNKPVKITASYGTPNLFGNPQETILYLPIEPEKEITKLHEKINNENKNLINFETSLYHTDEVPPFLPHISLDYNFTYNSTTLPKLEDNLDVATFNLIGPFLMVQRPSGNWIKVNN